MELIKQLENYYPWNEQEQHDKELILNCLKENKDVFLRESQLAHITVSAWVVNKEHTKVLMCYHNIYQSWSWLGGHADGDTNLMQVAIREVQEESGLQTVHPVTEDIFSIEILTVEGHQKKGNYVSSHLHLNLTYLLEADENEKVSIKPDENSGIGWFSFEDAINSSTEPWFQEHIYKKLNHKLRDYI